MTDTLKLKVEETFGKKITTQKDCTSLSYKILEETGEIISQSTIRRFWGLLKSNSQTSKKTIESLCIYCGYKSWDEFVQQNSGKSASEIFNEKLWISSIRRCNAETTSTLEIIKRRCGIKFELAIDRKFAADRLDLFLRSHYTATALIGPGGFGKSTMSPCKAAITLEQYIITQGKNIGKPIGRDRPTFCNTRLHLKCTVELH